MEKKLPSRILDQLRNVGWAQYDGDNPLFVGTWIREGVALRLTPARRIPKMWHAGITRPNGNDSRFVSEDDLRKIIGE